ncbi:hypothetical protein OCL94_00030 [Macrococcus sp. TMW 2.2395]|nr:hypothetical protein [Macrococcus sp. TMW 2.2395]
MKKFVSVLAISSFVISGITVHDVDAATLKPSDLKIGARTYEAVLTKTTKALSGNRLSDKMITLPKGKKVTVVERKQ